MRSDNCFLNTTTQRTQRLSFFCKAKKEKTNRGLRCGVRQLIAGCLRLNILVLFSVLLVGCGERDQANKPLMCHVGGTMTPVLMKLGELYKQKTGKAVEVSSAGSGELLATIEMQQEGDLYVAHDPFMDIIMRKGLAVNAWTIAEIYPVLIVQKGNPKKIKGLKDLRRKDVEVYLTSYRHSTLGHMLPTIFGKAGIDFDALNREKVIPTHRSGSHIANIIKMGGADVALVWQAVAHLRRDGVDYIPIPQQLPVVGVDAITSATGKTYFLRPVRVTISSLMCSRRQSDSADFVDFLLSPEGIKVFKEYGFGFYNGLTKQEYANGIKME